MSKNAISILSTVEMSLNTKTKWEEPLGLDKKGWKTLYNYILDKDQRIDKAIEYINEAIEDTDIEEVINTDELLDILRGNNE